MKTLVTNYTFSASAKQVTLTDYPSLKLDQILLITNVTDNIIVYNFADPTAGGTLAGNVLTLLYNTTSMSDSDRLQIFIDDYTVPATEASLTAVQVKIDNTNVLLNALTAKQDTFNFDISSVNVNTNELESLITNSNTRLDVLTAVDYATSTKQDLTNTLLNALTAKETTISLDVSSINLNTDQIETKLDTVNSNLDGINNNINNVEPLLDTTNTRLQTIATQTAFGTNVNQPLYVNPGALLDTVDSVSIDKSIGQTATTALTSKVFVTGSRKVYNIFGITTASTNQYLQIYNSTTSAVPTSTPIGVFLIPANSNFSFDLNRGLNFTSGALIVNSITPVVYTQGNDDLFITVVHN